MNIFPFIIYDARSLWIPVREPKLIWESVDARIINKSEIEFSVYGFYRSSGDSYKDHIFKRVVKEKTLAPFIDRRLKELAKHIVDHKAFLLRQAEIRQQYEILKKTL